MSKDDLQVYSQITRCIHVQYLQDWTGLSPSQSTVEESGRPHMHHMLMKHTSHKLYSIFSTHTIVASHSNMRADRHHLFVLCFRRY